MMYCIHVARPVTLVVTDIKMFINAFFLDILSI